MQEASTETLVQQTTTALPLRTTHAESYSFEISWNEAGQSTGTFSYQGGPAFQVTPCPPELMAAKNFMVREASDISQNEPAA